MTNEDLIDTSIMQTAREKYEAIWKRAREAEAEVQAAQVKLTEAIKRREGLAGKAVAGEAVGAAELRKAEDGVRDAETALVFARDVSRQLAEAQNTAHDELSASSGKAAAPLARHGAAQLLAAAKRRDEAMVLVRAAEADMDAAAEAVRMAIHRGFKVKHGISATRPGFGVPEPPPARYHTHAEAAEVLRSAGIPADDLVAA